MTDKLITDDETKRLAAALAAVHSALPNNGWSSDAQEAIDALASRLGTIYGVDLSDLEIYLEYGHREAIDELLEAAEPFAHCNADLGGSMVVIDPARPDCGKCPGCRLKAAAKRLCSNTADEKTYKLLVDVKNPDTGPPMKAGMLVRILTAGHGVVLVETVNEHFDPGSGDTSKQRSRGRVENEDIEEYGGETT